VSRAAAVFACPYCSDDNLFPHETETPGVNAPEIKAAWECRSCMRAFAVTFLGQLRRSDAANPAGGEDA
jgi:transposase-like protein